MKVACLVLTVFILIAIMAVCIMVKFATEITLQEKRRDYITGGGVYNLAKSMGVISLSDNISKTMSERFPFVAAITRNSSNVWTFSCFGSVILSRWIVTSAHCRRQGTTHTHNLHRVLVYNDFARNYTHTYPILFWRLHERFNLSNTMPRYDIAVAKLNLDHNVFPLRTAMFDDQPSDSLVEASVWKTVSTMDKKMFLTNDFDKIIGSIVPKSRCYENYGLALDDSLICVDFSYYEDCFVHEFGPLFVGDKVVGVLAVKPRDCDVRLAIFTNISYYANWILSATH
ncbi:hypothetical protein evm_005601 [Chilo suppressalis]|nr:hypothetical protein evm_005601 [Chilo suppressalis]